MRNLTLPMAAITMGMLFAQPAANAQTVTPADRSSISAWARDAIHNATWYKKRRHYRRHHYGYDWHDRYERRHYRERRLRRKLRRHPRSFRHRFHDRGWHYHEYRRRHWN